jgi:hypothetical protein
LTRPFGVPTIQNKHAAIRRHRQEKKVRLDKSESLTPRELELIALFRVLTESDRRLLLSMVESLISAETKSAGGSA